MGNPEKQSCVLTASGAIAMGTSQLKATGGSPAGESCQQHARPSVVFVTQRVSVSISMATSSFRKTERVSAGVATVGEHMGCLGVLHSPKEGNHLQFPACLPPSKSLHTHETTHTRNSPLGKLSPTTSTCHITTFSLKNIYK